jgi:hypothetical protein
MGLKPIATKNPLSAEGEERVDKRSEVGVSRRRAFINANVCSAFTRPVYVTGSLTPIATAGCAMLRVKDCSGYRPAPKA